MQPVSGVPTAIVFYITSSLFLLYASALAILCLIFHKRQPLKSRVFFPVILASCLAANMLIYMIDGREGGYRLIPEKMLCFFKLFLNYPLTIAAIFLAAFLKVRIRILTRLYLLKYSLHPSSDAHEERSMVKANSIKLTFSQTPDFLPRTLPKRRALQIGTAVSSTKGVLLILAGFLICWELFAAINIGAGGVCVRTESSFNDKIESPVTFGVFLLIVLVLCTAFTVMSCYFIVSRIIFFFKTRKKVQNQGSASSSSSSSSSFIPILLGQYSRSDDPFLFQNELILLLLSLSTFGIWIVLVIFSPNSKLVVHLIWVLCNTILVSSMCLYPLVLTYTWQRRKVNLWQKSASSFESTLKAEMLNPHFVKAFRSYAKKEFSVENVEFWIQSEELLELQSKEEFMRGVLILVDRFLLRESPFEVNSNTIATRGVLRAAEKYRIQARAPEESPISIDQLAEMSVVSIKMVRKDVLKNMEDTYVRFVQTKTYSKLQNHFVDIM